MKHLITSGVFDRQRSQKLLQAPNFKALPIHSICSPKITCRCHHQFVEEEREREEGEERGRGGEEEREREENQNSLEKKMEAFKS